jgi:hypothetical protein
MKKLILFLILFCSPAWAQDCQEPLQTARLIGPMLGGVSVAPASCADTSCTGFLICQNFEGAGYDHTEVWAEIIGTGGTVDEDDTTATILRGSQELKVYAGNAGQISYAYFTLTVDQGELYAHFKFKTTDATPSADTINFRFLDAAASSIVVVSLKTTGVLEISCGGQLGTTVATLSDDTAYHVWVHYKKDAAVAQYSVGFSTTTTEPTSGNYYYGNNNGASNVDVHYILLESRNQQTVFFDQTLVKTTSIGTVCN